MHGLGLFLHVAGVAVWLGASLTFMVLGPAAKKLPLASWASVWLNVATIQRVLVAPAAAVATVTGLVLTMALAKSGADMGSMTWLMVMQGFGLIAGILTIAFITPLTNRMASLARRALETGELDQAATEKVRKALAMTGSIAGVMVLVALFFATARP